MTDDPSTGDVPTVTTAVVTAPAPPLDTPAGVRFTRPRRAVELPSFGAWVQSMGFEHGVLSVRQLDSMLGIFLSSHAD